MYIYRYSILFKAIAIALVCLFSANSVLLAAPDTLAPVVGNPQTYDNMRSVMESKYAAKCANHQGPIDKFILEHSGRAKSLYAVVNLNQEFEACIEACKANTMLTRLRDTMRQSGPGQIQVIFLRQDEKPREFDGKPVWGHAGTYVTVFVSKEEEDALNGRNEEEALKAKRKIVGRLFHEIRARSKRAKELFDKAWGKKWAGEWKQNPPAPGEIDAFIKEQAEEFEKDNINIQNQIEQGLYITDPVVRKELQEEFENLEFAAKLDIINRDYAMAAEEAAPKETGPSATGALSSPEDQKPLPITPQNWSFINQLWSVLREPDAQQLLDKAQYWNAKINPTGHFWSASGRANDIAAKAREYFLSLPIKDADKALAVIEEVLKNVDDHGGVFGVMLIYFRATDEGKTECIFVVLDQGPGFLERNKKPLPISVAIKPGVTTKGYPDNMGLGLHVIDFATNRIDIIGISAGSHARRIGTYYQKSATGEVKTISLKSADLKHLNIPSGVRLMGSFEVEMKTAIPAAPPQLSAMPLSEQIDYYGQLPPKEQAYIDSLAEDYDGTPKVKNAMAGVRLGKIGVSELAKALGIEDIGTADGLFMQIRTAVPMMAALEPGSNSPNLIGRIRNNAVKREAFLQSIRSDGSLKGAHDVASELFEINLSLGYLADMTSRPSDIMEVAKQLKKRGSYIGPYMREKLDRAKSSFGKIGAVPVKTKHRLQSEYEHMCADAEALLAVIGHGKKTKTPDRMPSAAAKGIVTFDKDETEALISYVDGLRHQKKAFNVSYKDGVYSLEVTRTIEALNPVNDDPKRGESAISGDGAILNFLIVENAAKTFDRIMGRSLHDFVAGGDVLIIGPGDSLDELRSLNEEAPAAGSIFVIDRDLKSMIGCITDYTRLPEELKRKTVIVRDDFMKLGINRQFELVYSSLVLVKGVQKEQLQNAFSRVSGMVKPDGLLIATLDLNLWGSIEPEFKAIDRLSLLSPCILLKKSQAAARVPKETVSIAPQLVAAKQLPPAAPQAAPKAKKSPNAYGQRPTAAGLGANLDHRLVNALMAMIMERHESLGAADDFVAEDGDICWLGDEQSGDVTFSSVFDKLARNIVERRSQEDTLHIADIRILFMKMEEKAEQQCGYPPSTDSDMGKLSSRAKEARTRLYNQVEHIGIESGKKFIMAGWRKDPFDRALVTGHADLEWRIHRAVLKYAFNNKIEEYREWRASDGMRELPKEILKEGKIIDEELSSNRLSNSFTYNEFADLAHSIAERHYPVAGRFLFKRLQALLERKGSLRATSGGIGAKWIYSCDENSYSLSYGTAEIIYHKDTKILSIKQHCAGYTVDMEFGPKATTINKYTKDEIGEASYNGPMPLVSINPVEGQLVLIVTGHFFHKLSEQSMHLESLQEDIIPFSEDLPNEQFGTASGTASGGASEAAKAAGALPEWYKRPDATHYEVLGVKPDAAPAQIRTARNYLAKRWHPDICPYNKAAAEEITKRINAAYDILSDADKRREYDQTLSFGRPGQRAVDAGDIFNEEYLGAYRRMRDKIVGQQHEEMKEMLASAGLSQATLGTVEVNHLMWGDDGRFYVNSRERVRHAPSSMVSVFNPMEEPKNGEWSWGKQIFLGNYLPPVGVCSQLSLNPSGDSIGMIAIPSTPYHSKIHPKVFMVFKWDDLMEKAGAWLNLDYKETLYRINELEQRGEFGRDGLVKLPGCIGCLVLRSMECPVFEWSFDGAEAVIVDEDGTVINWNIKERKTVKTKLGLPAQNAAYKQDNLTIPHISISPGGLFAAVSYPFGILPPEETEYNRTGPLIQIWDLKSKRLLRSRAISATGINWDADGNLIFTEDTDDDNPDAAGIFLWNWSEDKEPEEIASTEEGIGILKISPDGRFLAVVKSSNRALEVIDLRTRERAKISNVVNYAVTSLGITLNPYSEKDVYLTNTLAWSPDGLYLATGGGDGQIAVWKIENKPQKLLAEGRTLVAAESRDRKAKTRRLPAKEKKVSRPRPAPAAPGTFPDIQSYLREYFRDRKRISLADLDTGSGELLPEFDRRLRRVFDEVDIIGAETAGVFVKEKGYKILKGVAPECAGDYERSELYSNPRDIITINKITKPDAFYKHLPHILKQDGLLLITVEVNNCCDGVHDIIKRELEEKGFIVNLMRPVPEGYYPASGIGPDGAVLVCMPPQGVSTGYGPAANPAPVPKPRAYSADTLKAPAQPGLAPQGGNGDQGKKPRYGNTESLASYVGDLEKAISCGNHARAFDVIMGGFDAIQNETEGKESAVNFRPFKNNLEDFIKAVYSGRAGPGSEELALLCSCQNIVELKERSVSILPLLKQKRESIIAFISSLVIEITDDNFERFLAGKTVVVSVGSQLLCRPCQEYGPIFEEVARTYKEGAVTFAKFELPLGMGSSFRRKYLRVGFTLPITYIIVDGVVKASLTGKVNTEKLSSFIDENIKHVHPPAPQAPAAKPAGAGEKGQSEGAIGTAPRGPSPDAHFKDRYYNKAITVFGQGVMKDRFDLDESFQGRCEDLRWRLVDEAHTSAALSERAFPDFVFPSLVIVVSTDRCTRNCAFCVTDASPANKLYINKDYLHRALLQIKQPARGVYPRVLFTGGEALIHPEIEALLSENRDFVTGIFTNADFAAAPGKAEAKVKWLEHLINPNNMRSPTNPFEFKISLDGLHGDGRRSVEKVYNLICALWAYFPEARIDLSCQRMDQASDGSNPLLAQLFDRLAPDREAHLDIPGGVILAGERNISGRKILGYQTFNFLDTDMMGIDPMYQDRSIEVRHYPLIFQNRGFLLYGLPRYVPDLIKPFWSAKEENINFTPIVQDKICIAPDGTMSVLDAFLDSPRPVRLANISDPDCVKTAEAHLRRDPLVYMLRLKGGLDRIIQLSAEFDAAFTEKLINTPLFMRDGAIDDRRMSLNMSAPQILYWITLNPERRMYITMRLLQDEAADNKHDIISGVLDKGTPPESVRAVTAELVAGQRTVDVARQLSVGAPQRNMQVPQAAPKMPAKPDITMNTIPPEDRILGGVPSSSNGGDLQRFANELSQAAPFVYIVMRKPPGYVSQRGRDEKNRPNVYNLLSDDIRKRVGAVGRLDVDTEGLLLFTDNGNLNDILTSPLYHVSKTYRVAVKGFISDDEIRALSEGVDIMIPAARDNGKLRRPGKKMEAYKTKPAEVTLVSRDKVASIIEITIREGKNRQIRRMCSKAGHRVLNLERVRFGPLDLTGLEPGGWRYLTADEVAKLMEYKEKAVAAAAKPAGAQEGTSPKKDLKASPATPVPPQAEKDRGALGSSPNNAFPDAPKIDTTLSTEIEISVKERERLLANLLQHDEAEKEKGNLKLSPDEISLIQNAPADWLGLQFARGYRGPLRLLSENDISRILGGKELFPNSHVPQVSKELFIGRRVLVAPCYGDLPFFIKALGAREVVGIDIDPLTIACQKERTLFGKTWLREYFLRFNHSAKDMEDLIKYLKFTLLMGAENVSKIKGISFACADLTKPLPVQGKFDLVVVPYLFGVTNGIREIDGYDKAFKQLLGSLDQDGRILVLPVNASCSDSLMKRHCDILADFSSWLIKNGYAIEFSPTFELYEFSNRGTSVGSYAIIKDRVPHTAMSVKEQSPQEAQGAAANPAGAPAQQGPAPQASIGPISTPEPTGEDLAAFAKEWEKMELVPDEFLSALSPILRLDMPLEHNKSVFVFSERIAFDNKLVKCLPKLIEKGIKVAVIVSTDDKEKASREEAAINRLNEGKEPDMKILQGNTMNDINEAAKQAHIKPARFYCFRMKDSVDPQFEGYPMYELTPDMVKRIIDAIGSACSVDPKKLPLLHELAKQFAEAA